MSDHCETHTITPIKLSSHSNQMKELHVWNTITFRMKVTKDEIIYDY